MAFKLALSESIPRVSYSTLLDTFILGNVFFAAAVAFGVTVTSSLCSWPSNSPWHQAQYLFPTAVSSSTAAWYAVTLLLLVNVGWAAYCTSRVGQGGRVVQTESGRNWYCFRFGPLPYYLEKLKTA